MSEAANPNYEPAQVDDPHGERSVTPFELFFDLVFVFAFTQVTGFMAYHTSLLGVAQGMAMLAALWWAWGGYSWLATIVDPEEIVTRLLLLGAMGAMLICSLAVPDAFGEAAVAFGVSYAVVRVIHIVVFAWLVRRDQDLLGAVARMTPTSFAGPGLIIASAWTEGTARAVIWAVALAIDYGGVLFGGGSGWRISARHFAERHGLIFIVALGESIVALGIGAGKLPVDALTVTAALLGLLVIGTLWWTYFDVVALVAENKLVSAEPLEQARMARDSYSYLHMPMIAGVILFALGLKKTIEHPADDLSQVAAGALCGGIAVYLVAHVLFRLRNIRTWNRQRSVAAVALIALGAFGSGMTSLTMLASVAGICTALVAYETIRFRQARQRVRTNLRH